MKAYQSEPVKNLPDAYRKDKDSNNYKILEIERTTNNGLRNTLAEIESILDINNAFGKTLDYYGARVGQPRGAATDAQYLIMIKSKILQNLSNGTYESVVDAICYMLSCDPSEIQIVETEAPCTIEMVAIPLEAIISAGFTASQITALVKRLLPVGITIYSVLYEGTFEFSDSENEYSPLKGFAEVENATPEDIGGYLGMTSAEEHETILPI